MKLLLGGYYSFYLPHNQREIEVQLTKPTRLSNILNDLGIPQGEIYLVVVNNELVDSQIVFVSQNDQVSMFPPVAGG